MNQRRVQNRLAVLIIVVGIMISLALWGLWIVAAPAVSEIILWWQNLRADVKADNSVNWNTWIGFWGSLIGASLGGLFAVLVLRMTLRHERSQREIGAGNERLQKRKSLVAELHEIIHNMELDHTQGFNFPDARVAAQKAVVLTVRISLTWSDEPLPRRNRPLIETRPERPLRDWDPRKWWLGQKTTGTVWLIEKQAKKFQTAEDIVVEALEDAVKVLSEEMHKDIKPVALEWLNDKLKPKLIRTLEDLSYGYAKYAVESSKELLRLIEAHDSRRQASTKSA